jgi:SusD/RagB-like outer membrane lipoprotein
MMMTGVRYSLVHIRTFKLSLLVSLLILIGCDYGDYNVDPTRPSDVSINLLLAPAITQSAYNQGAITARMPGIIMQHFDGLGAQQAAYSIYNIEDGVFDWYWWQGSYGGVMKDSYVIIEKAEADPAKLQPHYAGIARILMARELGILASSFGDVPYTQAFQGLKLIQVPFDTQEEIYGIIQNLLDTAIINLSQEGGPIKINSANDLIFAGDSLSWIATANSLKARYYMHISKRDPGAADKALTALNAGAITSNAGQPDFIFSSNNSGASPWAKFGFGRPNTMMIHQGFFERMSANSDPRINKYMVYDGTNWLFYAPGAGLFWTENESPLPLISYTEVKFIEAEAYLLKGDDVNASNALNEAITANMDYLGINPVAYNPYVSNNSDLTVFATAEEKMEKLMEEKYVALYAQAEPEIWADYRKTGYPQLTPAAGGDNAFNPGGEIPRRWQYTLDEKNQNPENVRIASERQGGALMNNYLWSHKN